MKILLSGGGTLGPVAPLLAIAEIYRKHNPQAEFVWIGTKTGPEKDLVEHYQIPFFAVTSGKLRRYFSGSNFLDIFRIIIGFWQSLALLRKEEPCLLITAGGFVSVPLHFAAFLLGIPTWVHQQDFELGLANRLMSCISTKITTSLQQTKKYCLAKKTEWIGNPARDLSVVNPDASHQKFGIPSGAPVILAMGGGTGSETVNRLILEALSFWPQNYHIIHLVGKERSHKLQENYAKISSNYHVYQFLKEDIKDAYAIADVVIARAGFSTITELAALSKAAILVPISGSHQEVNAKFFADQQAVIVMKEAGTNGLKLAETVSGLINSPATRQSLAEKLHTVLPPAKSQKVIEILESLVGEK